jgi:hypothetical protein
VSWQETRTGVGSVTRERMAANRILESQVMLEVPGDGCPGRRPDRPGQVLARLDDQIDGGARIAVGEVFGRRERGSNAASLCSR